MCHKLDSKKSAQCPQVEDGDLMSFPSPLHGGQISY